MKIIAKLKIAIKMAVLTIGFPFLFFYYLLTGDNKLVLSLLKDLENDFENFKKLGK